MKKSKNKVTINPDRSNKNRISKRLTKDLFEYLENVEKTTQLTPNAQTEMLLTLKQHGLITESEFKKIAGVLSNNNLHPDTKILVGYDSETVDRLVLEFRNNIKKEGVEEYILKLGLHKIINDNSLVTQMDNEKLKELNKEKERLIRELKKEKEEHNIDTELYIELHNQYKNIESEYNQLIKYIKSLEIVIKDMGCEKENLEVKQGELRGEIIEAAERIIKMENNNRALHERIDELTEELNKKVAMDGLDKLNKTEREHVLKMQNELYKIHTKSDVDNIVRLIANSYIDTQSVNLFIRIYRKSKKKIDLLPVVDVTLKTLTNNKKYIATNIFKENRVLCKVYDTARNKVLDKDYTLNEFISNVCDAFGVPYSCKTLSNYINTYRSNYTGFDVNNSLTYIIKNHLYITATSPHNYFTISLKGTGAESIINQLEDCGIHTDYLSLKEIKATLDKEEKEKKIKKYKATKWYKYTDLLYGILTNYHQHRNFYNQFVSQSFNNINIKQFEHFKKYSRIK